MLRANFIMFFFAVLNALSSQPSGARVYPNTNTNADAFVLEAYAGGVWSEIRTDYYRVLPLGYVLKRTFDNNNSAVNWNAGDYTAYRWTGLIWRPDGVVAISQEPVTFDNLVSPFAAIDNDHVLQMNMADTLIANELQAGDLLHADETGLNAPYVQIADVLRLGVGKQTKRPQTLANDASSGTTPWTNPQYARKRDDLRASSLTTGFIPGETTQLLTASNFGFKIPRGAKILGVVCEIEGYNDPEASLITYDALMTAGGTAQTGTLDTFAFDTKVSLGGAANTWGADLSPDVINASTFGVKIWAETNVFATLHYLNAITLTVYYRTAAGVALLDAGNNHIDNLGAVNHAAVSTTPGNKSASSDANVYVKSGKLIVQYNDGGTVRYKYLDLTGTGVTWTHTTSAP